MVIIKERRQFDKVKFQYVAIICANIVTLSHGCIMGWLSPYLPLLQSDGSPLDSGPVTLTQTSWIGGLVCVGGAAGTILFGVLVGYMGCKRSISFLAFPQLAFWICIIFGTHVHHLYIARFCAGLTGGGVFICIPLFVAEIADDKVRGSLGSLMLVNSNLGLLISFITGSYLDYVTIPYVMIVLPVLFFCIFGFLPDTPLHLLSIGKVKEAEKSLRFYRNYTNETKQDSNTFAEDFERMKNSTNQSQIDGDGFKWTYLIARAARKGLIIGIVLMTINQFSGCFALTNYTATIFRDSGSDMDPYMSSIILASAQICGTYVSTVLVDRLGRRILLITSATLTGIGLAAMGSYSFLGSNLAWDLSAFSWVPVTSLSFVIFIASIGILPLPFVVLAEILPQNIRAVGSTICVVSISVMSFVVLKTFPILSNMLGLYGCMWIFSGVSLMGAVFIWLFVEETKGKNLGGMARSRGLSIY